MHLGANLLLDVLADLVINLELFFDRLELILVDLAALNRLLGWRYWRGEEVEEGRGGTRFPDQTSAVGVWAPKRGQPIGQG